MQIWTVRPVGLQGLLSYKSMLEFWNFGKLLFLKVSVRKVILEGRIDFFLCFYLLII